MNLLTPRFSALFSARPWLRRTLIGVTMAGLSLSGLAACGHNPGSFGRDGAAMTPANMAQHRDRMVERVTSQLSLDATQKKHLVALIDTVHEQRQAMMGAPGAASSASGPAAGPRAELQALITGPRFDAQAAQALANRKADAMKTASPKVIAAFATFYDSLKPEQQQKVRDFLNSRGPGSRQGHGQGHGHGHGGWGY
jgi:Spy/CpxP family protein refolding chaperone